MESEVEEELLDKLIMIAHANPYWLFDPECTASYAEDDPTNNAVRWGDAFSSSSTAASVVYGGSASGPAMWKDENGVSLGEINK